MWGVGGFGVSGGGGFQSLGDRSRLPLASGLRGSRSFLVLRRLARAGHDTKLLSHGVHAKKSCGLGFRAGVQGSRQAGRGFNIEPFSCWCSRVFWRC